MDCASRWFIGVCVWSLLTYATAADVAQPGEYEGRIIQEIRFDPPRQPVANEDLSRSVTFRKGAPLHLADVRTVIKQLYATGRFDNIEIDTEPAANGVVLIVRTKEQWFVGGVEVMGKVNRPPNEGQLANATRLQLGTPFNDDEVETAVKGIRTQLERNLRGGQ